jgi:hypothetical protein
VHAQQHAQQLYADLLHPAATTALLPLLLCQTKDSHNIKILGQKGFATTQLFKAKTLNFESLGIGGLDRQFDAIFRRAFASRVFPPSIVQRLGIQHVKVRCAWLLQTMHACAPPRVETPVDPD